MISHSSISSVVTTTGGNVLMQYNAPDPVLSLSLDKDIAGRVYLNRREVKELIEELVRLKALIPFDPPLEEADE